MPTKKVKLIKEENDEITKVSAQFQLNIVFLKGGGFFHIFHELIVVVIPPLFAWNYIFVVVVFLMKKN